MAHDLIILGASARAAAGSALRAGYTPWCIDQFADRDLQAIATVHQCPPDQYPMGILPRMDHAPPNAPILLTGAMENHPRLLQALALQHPILGSSIQAIQRVRDPLALASLQPTAGLRLPRVRTHVSLLRRTARLLLGNWGRRRWLIKPIASGGGRDIDWWSPGKRLRSSRYLQEFIRGDAYSAVFHADGWSANLLGITEQLVGEPACKAPPFAYCGSIGPIALSEKLRAALAHLAVQLTQRYDVRGLFGIDFLMDWRGRVAPVEVNPRYTSSVEILEAATGQPLLAASASRARSATPAIARTHGKAILYAHRTLRVADLYDHLDPALLADVPHPNARIPCGQPICTLFATGPTPDACRKTLLQRARQLHQQAISDESRIMGSD